MGVELLPQLRRIMTGAQSPWLSVLLKKNENDALLILFHYSPHNLWTDKLLCFHPGVAGYSSRFHSQNILPDYILVRGTFIHSRQGDGRLLAFQTQSSFDLARLFLAGRYGLFSADRGPLGFLEIAQPLVPAFPFSHHSKLRKSKTGCRPGCCWGRGDYSLGRLY